MGEATQGKSARIWRWVRWILLVVVGCLILLKFFVIDIYTVPQAGMFPSISPGGRFLGLKHPYRDPSRVRRGDVVCFARRLSDGKTYQFVWRVVGLPGDRVEVQDDSVRVNGEALRREQVRTEGDLVIYREHNGEAAYDVAYPSSRVTAAMPQPTVTVTIPPGELFVLGDNRAKARDSRYDGNVAFGEIIAKKL